MDPIIIRTREGVTWLFAPLPGDRVQTVPRSEYIQPTLGGVEMRVGIDPTADELRCAIMQMEEYLYQPLLTGDDRDAYLIRGYEVLDRTARRYGNSGMVPVPARHVGKRFRIVCIDPDLSE